MLDLDDDAIVAAVDLVGRAGAEGFEIGFLHDDVPVEDAGWYAHAQYRGTRIIEEDHRGPTEAAEALARRLLTGAKCRCGRLVALSDGGAVAFPGARMADGSTWSGAEIEAAGQCRWTRQGRRWVRGCEDDPTQPPPHPPLPGPNRAARRAVARRRGAGS